MLVRYTFVQVSLEPWLAVTHQAQFVRTSLPTHHQRLMQAAALIVVLFALAWRAAPDGRLHVVFLKTDGDAALVQTPGGHYILIDGGSDPTAVTAALGQRLPFWRRSLEAVVLTATDQAHVAGQVAVLVRYHANIALAPPLTAQSSLLREWRHEIDEQATPLHTVHAGERLAIDGIMLHVFAPGDGKERGVLLQLAYGTTSVVFCQSSAAEDEDALARAGVLRQATVVTFPWQRNPHTALLTVLQPRAVVFTDGYEGAQPYEATLAERRIGNAKLYHEAIHGTIEWTSDGTKSWMKTDNAQQ